MSDIRVELEDARRGIKEGTVGLKKYIDGEVQTLSRYIVLENDSS